MLGETKTNIEATPVAVAHMFSQKSQPRPPTPPPSNSTANLTTGTDTTVNCKISTASLFSPVSNVYARQHDPTLKKAKNIRQPLAWSGVTDPNTTANMELAVTDMIHSNNQPFTFFTGHYITEVL